MRGLEDAWNYYIEQCQTQERIDQGWQYIPKLSKVSQVIISPSGEKITYYRFAKIIKTYCKNVSNCLIVGEQFNFNNGFGHLKARRVERDHSNLKININATNTLLKKGIDKKVYHFDDDWCRLKWCHRSGNEEEYKYLLYWKFVIGRTSRSDGLKNRFSRALSENDWLKNRYDYYHS